MSATSVRPRSAADCLIRSAVDISHPRQQANPPATSSTASGPVRSDIIDGLGAVAVGGGGHPSLVSSIPLGVVPGRASGNYTCHIMSFNLHCYVV